MFFDWHTPHYYRGELAADEIICRFVTSFATTADESMRSGRTDRAERRKITADKARKQKRRPKAPLWIEMPVDG